MWLLKGDLAACTIMSGHSALCSCSEAGLKMIGGVVVASEKDTAPSKVAAQQPQSKEIVPRCLRFLLHRRNGERQAGRPPSGMQGLVRPQVQGYSG